MKKCITLCLVFTYSAISFAQINFEKGYFITKAGEKIDCFIENRGWTINPSEFKFKLSENEAISTKAITEVKAFGIGEELKYIIKTVLIDDSRNSSDIGTLDTNMNPVFEEKELALKTLIHGKANLYEYRSSKNTVFFFDVDGKPTEQLIFKNYRKSNNNLGENTKYKQQLLLALKCGLLSKSDFEKINYSKETLLNIFKTYHTCQNTSFVNYEKANRKRNSSFNLTIRPRVNFISLALLNESKNATFTDFGSSAGFAIGVEGEYVWPSNRNKWALIFELTHQSFEGKVEKDASHVLGGKLISSVDYKSIELPLGFRHYMYLNDSNKIFLNAAYVLNFSSDTQLLITRENGSVYESSKIEPSNNLGFGVGYNYKNKINLEARYHTNRNIINSTNWKTEYSVFSFIVGYTIL